MKKQPLLFVVMAALLLGSAPLRADSPRRPQPVQFAKGASSVALKGRVVGRAYVDYQLRAAAGQRLVAQLTASHGGAYFNVLPAGTTDYAMFVGSTAGERFEGVLPDDGVYTLRVYLMRAAARRDEASDFTLSLAVDGQALAALPATSDARVPGTRFHAQGAIECAPAYTPTRQCAAGVIRRGHDGTATVVLRWDAAGVRRILFVRGQPLAADVPQAMSVSRNERGDYLIVFDGEERFTVPEALVFGG